MISMSIAEAESQLQKILHSAETGEKVTLTRANVPVIQVIPIHKARKPLQFAKLVQGSGNNQPPQRVALRGVTNEVCGQTSFVTPSGGYGNFRFRVLAEFRAHQALSGKSSLEGLRAIRENARY